MKRNDNTNKASPQPQRQKTKKGTKKHSRKFIYLSMSPAPCSSVVVSDIRPPDAYSLLLFLRLRATFFFFLFLFSGHDSAPSTPSEKTTRPTVTEQTRQDTATQRHRLQQQEYSCCCCGWTFIHIEQKMASHQFLHPTALFYISLVVYKGATVETYSEINR